MPRLLVVVAGNYEPAGKYKRRHTIKFAKKDIAEGMLRDVKNRTRDVAGNPSGDTRSEVELTGGDIIMSMLRKLPTCLYILLIISCSSPAEDFHETGQVIEVHPGESVQGALDQAKPGDTVLVHPGTYSPRKAGEAFITFQKRHNGVKLTGKPSAPEKVVLDGKQKVLHVVYFDQGIERSTELSGFTITGGFTFPEKILPAGRQSELRSEISRDNDFYYDGAGVMIYNSSPLINDNIITRNRSARCGGGISVFRSRHSFFSLPRWENLFIRVQGPAIINNLISHNRTTKTGAGIDVYNGTKALIINNLLWANDSEGIGGAIAVLAHASAEIHGNTVVGNSAECSGSGVQVLREAKETHITNTIFTANSGSDVINTQGKAITVEASCFYNNDGTYSPPTQAGNISAPPLFVKDPNGDFYLSQIGSSG